MMPETGLYALVAALFLAGVQIAMPFLPLAFLPSGRQARRWVLPALLFLLLTLAFACLIAAHATSDFSVLNVVENSHRDKPLIYKITGAWGNHEGSMLLWVWVLGLYGFAFSCVKREESARFAQWVSAVQGAVMAGFLAFILYTSNPFTRIFPPPASGKDLNPLLQDIGLALHPPFLYLGYVGFSIVYAMAVAALIEGKMGRNWARITQPWILITWSMLTIGIGLGSWWAYHELGWGGFWFWDPVENASLLPWLAGTALLHSNRVLEKRGQLKHWVLLLAILTFSLSLVGTFLVRSGVLTSVHSFASDPTRGIFILIYLLIVTGGALALYAFRAPAVAQKARLSFFSREGSIVLNNLFLLTACGTVLLATLYPVILDMAGYGKISIGPRYYLYTIAPIAIAILLAAALGPMMGWQTASSAWLRPILLSAASVSFLAILLIGLLSNAVPLLPLVCLGAGIWLVTGTLHHLWCVSQRFNPRRLRQLPPAFYGMLMAHLGLGILAISAIAATYFQSQAELRAHAGDRVNIGGVTMRLDGIAPVRGPNYLANAGRMTVLRGQREIAELTPEFRFYPVRGSTTSEASIYYAPWYDAYAVMGESDPAQGTALRLYVTPLMSGVWGGCLMVAAGGLLALLGRNDTRQKVAG